MNESHRKWWILAALSGVLAMVVLDETVVGVALPTIQRELGMSLVSGHWVINAYLLVFTVFVTTGGKLGDIFGHRWLFVSGLAIFGLASLASGFAEDGALLITARAIQGIGAAVIFPASVAMITAVFPVEQRGLVFGIQTAVGGTFMSLGPLVGGMFTEIFSWRWIFWINLPIAIGIASLVLAAWVPPPRDTRTSLIDKLSSIDYRGLVTLVAGLGALVFAIMEAPDRGWLTPLTLILLLGGAVNVVAFVIIELRSSKPLIELDLFRNRTFTACNLVVFAGQFSKFAVVVFGALYLQHVLHFSPIQAGIALLAAVVPTLVTSIPAGRLADRFGVRWLSLTALLLNGSAMLWISYFVGWKGFGLLVPGLVIWGLALPFHFVPVRRAIMGTVSADKHGQAGGINLAAQLLGGTVGMTVCGTLLATTGDFRIVYLVSAGLALVVLFIGLFALDRHSNRISP